MKRAQLSRRVFTIGSLLGLTGCGGFAPLHGANQTTSLLNGQIILPQLGGEEGFELRARLTERFGYAAATAPYRLELDLDLAAKPLGIGTSSVISRYGVRGTLSYRLMDAQDAATTHASGDLRSFSAYPATSATYPTRMAERDARLRLVTHLADLLFEELALKTAQFTP